MDCRHRGLIELYITERQINIILVAVLVGKFLMGHESPVFLASGESDDHHKYFDPVIETFHLPLSLFLQDSVFLHK